MKKRRGKKWPTPLQTVSGEAPRPPDIRRSLTGAPSAETRGRAIRQAASLVLSLSKRWASEGVPRDVIIGSLAAIVAGSGEHGPIADLFIALHGARLVDVTAIEILLRIVDNRPSFVPGVRRGTLLANGESPDIDVEVGRPTTLELVPGVRVVSCSLLGGGAPSHEVVVAASPASCAIRVDARGTWPFGIVASMETDDVLVLDLLTVHARS